jgi:integrase
MEIINKYDALIRLRQYLSEKYCKNTIEKYCCSVKAILDRINKLDLNEISTAELETELRKTKTKNDFSAAKNGFKALHSIYPELDFPLDSFYIETSKKKRNFRKRDFSPISADTIERKINGLRDKRVKLGFRVMLRGGLRVAEASMLEAGDVAINGEEITVQVKHGKGGKARTVSFTDRYIAEQLPALMEETREKLFYSDSYMQEIAADKGIECHDLRRIYAQRAYRQMKTPDNTRYDANALLMEQMGHAKWRTTKIYLRRKIEL